MLQLLDSINKIMKLRIFSFRKKYCVMSSKTLEVIKATIPAEWIKFYADGGIDINKLRWLFVKA